MLPLSIQIFGKNAAFSDDSASEYNGDTSLTVLVPEIYECVRHFTSV